jgi:glycosyltransferase involved in cell wall biosynthesis
MSKSWHWAGGIIQSYFRGARVHLRRNWSQPPCRVEANRRANVAIVTVNWNTATLIAQLLFSICRVVGREQVKRIVVVDNNSDDGSQALLEALSRAGVIDVIYNKHQRYHGPGLNDGIHFLERLQRNSKNAADAIDYIWVIDSDCIILRDDVINDSVAALRKSGAGLCGQFQDEAMPEGYAHVSSLLFDPARAWRRGFCKFEEHGVPALALQRSMLKNNIPRLDFPFRDNGYLLHPGRGTLRVVRERAEITNNYYSWAEDHWEPGYHDVANGKVLHDEFLAVFNKEVPELSPQALVSACMRQERIRLHLPCQKCRSYDE